LTLYVFRCPKCPAQVRLHNTPHAMMDCLGVPPHAPLAMDLLTDADAALLPLDAEPCMPSGARMSIQAGIAPLKVEHLHKAGMLHPETQDALEWMYRHRETNGMAGAFLKVGGRRCVDLVAFARLMREQRA
jgi:hypothetical protein